MRMHLLVAALFFALAPSAWAQTADTASEAVPAQETLTQAPAEEVQTGLRAEIEKLRSEMKAVLEETQSGAESIVRELPGALSLTDLQVFGIAVGIVAGAVAADLLGASGLATISLAAGGGVLGNWIAGAL